MYIKPITRGVSSSGEINDCLVRSAANAAGISYAESYSVFRRCGRNKNKGCSYFVWNPALKEMKFETVGIFGKSLDAVQHQRIMKCKQFDGMSLQKALKTFTEGRYVMMTAEHAFAVVDGELIDDVESPAKARVTVVFEFKGDCF